MPQLTKKRKLRSSTQDVEASEASRDVVQIQPAQGQHGLRLSLRALLEQSVAERSTVLQTVAETQQDVELPLPLDQLMWWLTMRLNTTLSIQEFCQHSSSMQVRGAVLEH